MLADVNPRWAHRTEDAARPFWADMVVLDTDWNVIAQESKENPIKSSVRRLWPIVMYTSAQPETEGVMIEHGSVVTTCCVPCSANRA